MRNATLCGDLVGIEADLELRAVTPHLLENPFACGADAPRVRIRRRERVAGLEALELLQRRAEPIFGDRGDELHDPRIEIAVLRERDARSQDRCGGRRA